MPDANDSEGIVVEVVSADRVVWSGTAERIVTRTVDGDMGILPGHAPVLSLLAPNALEVVSTSGDREIIAVEGGFISVAHNRVSILSEYAEIASEISLAQAQEELRDAEVELQEGDDTAEAKRRYQRASAQVQAAEKAS